jgi:hypothetical protein
MDNSLLLFSKLPFTIFVILEQSRAVATNLLSAIEDRQRRVLTKECIAITRIDNKD